MTAAGICMFTNALAISGEALILPVHTSVCLSPCPSVAGPLPAPRAAPAASAAGAALLLKVEARCGRFSFLLQESCLPRSYKDCLSDNGGWGACPVFAVEAWCFPGVIPSKPFPGDGESSPAGAHCQTNTFIHQPG